LFRKKHFFLDGLLGTEDKEERRRDEAPIYSISDLHGFVSGRDIFGRGKRGCEKKEYKMNCSPCHGEEGKGDGVGARLLPVKPADHSDGNIMNNRSDKYLSKIISKGSSAVGDRPICQPGVVYSAISKSVTSSPIFEA